MKYEYQEEIGPHPQDISLSTCKYYQIWKKSNLKTVLFSRISDKGYLPVAMSSLIQLLIMFCYCKSFCVSLHSLILNFDELFQGIWPLEWDNFA
jgi:hypothetical protein